MTKRQKYLNWMLTLHAKRYFFGKTEICQRAHISFGAFEALQNLGFISRPLSPRSTGYEWIGNEPDLDLAEKIISQGTKCMKPDVYGQPHIDYTYGKVYGMTPANNEETAKKNAELQARENLAKAQRIADVNSLGVNVLNLSTEKVDGLLTIGEMLDEYRD